MSDAIRTAMTSTRHVLRSKLLWTALVLLLLYTVGGFFVAPALMQRYLPSFVEDRLGQRASVADIRINPFALTLEASGVRLEGDGDKALLAVDRLFVDLEISSLFRRAWTFADVRIEGADVGLEIDRAGRLNALAVLERLRSEPRADGGPPAILILHGAVSESRVSLVDLSGATHAAAALSRVDLEFFEIGTLADHRGRYTLAARLPAGGTLTANGDLSLEPLASSGRLDVREMNIQTPWLFLRDELKLAEPRGALTIAGEYDFRYENGAPLLAASAVQAELSDLFVALQGAKPPLLGLRTIRASEASFALATREIVVQSVLLSDGEVNARRSEGGAFDWQEIAAQEPTALAESNVEPRATPEGQPWRIRFEDVDIERIAVTYSDRSRGDELAFGTALNGSLRLDMTTGAAAHVIADEITLSLQTSALTRPGSDAALAGLELLEVSGASVDTRARTVHAAAVAVRRGDLRLARGAEGPTGVLGLFASPELRQTAPDTAEASARAWGVQLDHVAIEQVALEYADAAWKPAIAARLGALKGELRLDARLGGGPAEIVADAVQLALNDISLSRQDASAPLATLDAFTLSGGRVDTGARTLAAETVSLSDGGAKVVRGPDGSIALLEPFMSEKDPTHQRSSASPGAGWKYRVEAIALKRFAFALADHGYDPALSYRLRLLSAAARNVDSDSAKPIALTTEWRVGERGSASTKGTLRQDFALARLTLELAHLPLEPLQPLLARHAPLQLASGDVSASAELTYRRAGEPALTASGRLSVDDVLVNEAESGDRLVSWKTLTADAVAVSVAPNKLAIREVRVVEPGAKIIIAADRTINLADVLGKDSASERGAAGPAAQTAPSAQASAGPPVFLPYEIGRIRLENGTLDFADLSLVLPFATRVDALHGDIVGLSSAPDARAELKLEGEIGEYAEARAEGVLMPRSPTTFMDITARFDNVQMPLLSPYSATFAGRKIASGRLSLTLEYKIVDSQLAGENRIVLRDFELGERVEAPGALDLPLDLAVALLKDSEGRISLAVPVRGNVGNPEFDYGTVIRAAIGSALRRVVTAPFRMLAGLFGTADAEEIRTVEFAPGSARLAPAQREQLDNLARGLKERPQLKLVIRGPYDPERDGEQLRRDGARRELALRLGAQPDARKDPGPIAYGDADTQKALEALLAERAGPDGVAALENAYVKTTGREPDRVNPVLGFFGRGSEDRAFYEAVFEHIVELEPLPETAVRVLAANRAQAIVETLLKAGIERGRLEPGGIAPVEAAAGGPIATDLALGVGAS